MCVVVSVRLLQYTGLPATPSPRDRRRGQPVRVQFTFHGSRERRDFPQPSSSGSARVCSEYLQRGRAVGGERHHAACSTKAPAARLPRDSRKDGGSSSSSNNSNNSNKDPSVLEAFPYFQTELRDRVLLLVRLDGRECCACAWHADPTGPRSVCM